MSKRTHRRRAEPGAAAGANPASPPGQEGWRKTLGLALALSCLTFFAYWPAIHGGFIFDDPGLLTENPLIKAPDGLYRFWFTTEAPDYWPLTSTTFWLEWRAWGMNPTGYHVTNVALHTVEALLLWLILTRLGIGGAFLGALLFALHPVNVESVAWIAQRKNLVAMLFLQVSILCYLEADDRLRSSPTSLRPPAVLAYLVALGAFVLAMLGKGSAAVLPPLLLLLTWWRHGRVARPDLLRVFPFLAVATALVLVNVWFQTHGVGEPIRQASWGERLLGAGAVVWFYLAKALAPVRLAFVYPQWHIDVGNIVWWLPLLSALVVTGILWRSRRTGSRPLLFAWTFFGVALLPVMGLTDVYFMRYSLVADHYQHLALVAVVALAAAAWARWAQGHRRWLALATAGGAIVCLLAATRRQSALYKDEETLYTATLATNPGSWLAAHNLAMVLSAQGRRQEAIASYEKALAAKADLLEPRVNLGLLLAKEGRSDEAIAHLEAALRIDPDAPRVRYNLGVALAAAGRAEDAIPHFQELLRRSPADAEAERALGGALNAVGRTAEALSHFETALRLDPKSAGAHASFALALARSGRRPEAIAHYEEALRLEPEVPEAHYNLAILLTDAGRKDEAMDHYAEAVRLRPPYAVAHHNLALLLFGEGRSEEAAAHFREAVRARPDYFEARMALVETLTRLGRLPEARAEVETARELAHSTAESSWEKRFTELRERLPGGGEGRFVR